MPLLAYDQPASSPSGHLLHPRFREEAVEALNRAVLHQLGRKERSALETAYRQLVHPLLHIFLFGSIYLMNPYCDPYAVALGL
jgi:hypothetical protein